MQLARPVRPADRRGCEHGAQLGASCVSVPFNSIAPMHRTDNKLRWLACSRRGRTEAARTPPAPLNSVACTFRWTLAGAEIRRPHAVARSCATSLGEGSIYLQCVNQFFCGHCCSLKFYGQCVVALDIVHRWGGWQYTKISTHLTTRTMPFCRSGQFNLNIGSIGSKATWQAFFLRIRTRPIV